MLEELRCSLNDLARTQAEQAPEDVDQKALRPDYDSTAEKDDGQDADDDDMTLRAMQRTRGAAARRWTTERPALHEVKQVRSAISSAPGSTYRD